MICKDDFASFGELGDDDKEALRSLVRKVLKPGCQIVEIGSWLGAGSTRVIIEELQACGSGKLYCVDTWEGSKNVAHHQDIAARHDPFEVFLHNVKLAGGEDYVHPLKMRSGDAAAIMEDGSMDLIFIDGDHSYASASEDIALWKPKLREGGILCGHDCECRINDSLRDVIYASLDKDSIPGDRTSFTVIHPGVVAAVDEAFNGSANLWSETPFLRADGSVGRATLWDDRPPEMLAEQSTLQWVAAAESPPRLVGDISGYNIVLFAGGYYAVPQSLGSMDLSQLEISSMPPEILFGGSYEEAILAITIAELKPVRELLAEYKAHQDLFKARDIELNRHLNEMLLHIDGQQSQSISELKPVRDQLAESKAKQELSTAKKIELGRRLNELLSQVNVQQSQANAELEFVREQLKASKEQQELAKARNTELEHRLNELLSHMDVRQSQLIAELKFVHEQLERIKERADKDARNIFFRLGRLVECLFVWKKP